MTIELARPVVSVPASQGVPVARWLSPAVSAAADAASFALAFAVLTPVAGVSPEADAVGGMLLLAALLTLALRAAAGLYPGCRLHPEERLRRRLLTLLAAGIASALAALLLARGGPALALPTLAAFLILASLLHIALDTLARWTLHRAGLWGRPVAIVGTPQRSSEVAQFLARNWQYGLVPAPENDRTAHDALVADDAPPSAETLRRLHQAYEGVIVLSDLSRAPHTGLSPRGADAQIGWRFVAPPRPTYAGKRAFDIAIAIPALLVALPIVLLAGAVIAIVDPGPIFYRQRREGFGGRTISILKLRTMYRDAERMLQDVLERDPAARAEWNAHFKLRRDPRILPLIGPVLRATSLDELPQLLNILAGDMSLVGPRPFPAYHLAAMREEMRAKRATVMPGLTGLWQISERSEADVATQERLDEFYIDNLGFWFDLSIILRTVSCVLKLRGV
ncbi:sugar transferase [Acuticoccus kandeliae]|uniref:sugar transferase n=1 Tax=Acuticoccus kandeliae TaxID=2073160 RepID=UPI000D3EC262|nr:sugar transferase [Acuticoccus kandeliae]